MASPARDRRRDQLLSLGLELFASRPYDEVVIEDLAAAAGISKGLLYHYFGSKRAFYAACVRVAAHRLVDLIDPDELTEPNASVRVGIERYLDFLVAHEAVYRALILGGLGAEAQVQAVLEEARGAITALIASHVTAAGDDPLVRNTIRSWLGAVEAGGLDWLLHRTPDRDAFVRLQAVALAARVVDLKANGVALLPGIEEAARATLGVA